MSERIIKYRQENGPFMSIEEIMKVSGISEKKFEDIKEYIVVFSRVISNNSEAVLEFLEDGFGKAILDIGYIKLIMI